MSLLSPDPISTWINTAKLVCVGVFLVVVLGLIGYLAYTKSLLQTQVATDKANEITYQGAIDKWKTQAEGCALTVARINADSAAREALAVEAQKRAALAAAASDAAARAILALKPVGDDYRATIKLFNSVLGGR